MIYLYAIGEAGARAPDCLGLGEAPLEVAQAGDLTGIYSRHQGEAFDPEPAALWRHDSVVEAAMRDGAVLPVRFGTTFGEVEDVLSALMADRDRLRGRLEEVRGCVELAVRVSLPSPEPSAPRSGSEYIRVRLDRQREQRVAAERVLVPLEAHALRSRSPVRSTERGELTASFLVPEEGVERFADRVRILAEHHSDLALSCTGPWPPYSFVGEEER